VSLDEGRARFNDMIIDTLAGYFKGTDGAATGSDAYCAEFLEEMCARKRRGLFTAVSGVAYVPEERDYETAYTARPRG
jgi:hypothetical protein